MQSLKSQVEYVLDQYDVFEGEIISVWKYVLIEFYKQYLHCNNKAGKYSLRLEYADRVPGLDSIKNALKSIRRK